MEGVFANSVAATFSGAGWVTLFVIALLVYFYAHYTLASITAHILAMYPPFLAVLVAKGAPIGLVAFAFATFVNFAAGLTHYGTTPSPMFFAQDYVTMRDWWKIGFVVSVLNLEFGALSDLPGGRRLGYGEHSAVRSLRP